MFAGVATAVNVQIINNSGQQPEDIYLMLDNGSSSDGQLPNDTPKQLSQLTNSSFSLGSITAGRLYVSYGSPVARSEANNSPTRYDKIEFTNPGVANLTAVDFFGIPFDLQALDSNGNSVGQALTFSCHTSTLLPQLQAVGTASAQVNTGSGSFARFLSPQLAPSAYASMTPYIQSLVGQTITVNDTFHSTPSSTISFSGTMALDGSITLSGTLATPPGSPATPGSPLQIEGSMLSSAIYTGNGDYTVGGSPAHVSDNNAYSVIYRDFVAGFALDYWGGKYGNNSANWLGQPDFASARGSTDPFAAYNEYAATIGKYSEAYGYSFHDLGPAAVTVPLDASVATLELTIDSDQGPNVPECVGESTTNPPAPDPNPPSSGIGPSPTPGQQPPTATSPKGEMPGNGTNATSHTAKIAITSSAASLDKSGRALLKLACTGDPCKGILTLTQVQKSKGRRRSKSRYRVIGSVIFSVPEAASRNVRVQISKKGQEAVRRAGRAGLSVLAKTVLGPESRAAATTQRRVVLRRYLPKKAKKEKRRNTPSRQ